jgi:hypothetical protein
MSAGMLYFVFRAEAATDELHDEPPFVLAR